MIPKPGREKYLELEKIEDEFIEDLRKFLRKWNTTLEYENYGGMTFHINSPEDDNYKKGYPSLEVSRQKFNG